MSAATGTARAPRRGVPVRRAARPRRAPARSARAPWPRPRLWVIGPEWAEDVVEAPLRSAGATVLHRRRRNAAGAGADPYGVGEMLDAAAERPDAVLLVAPRNRAPGRLLPGPVVRGVPAGIVQAGAPGELAPWLAAVAGAASPSPGAEWAALAMGKVFYLELGRRFVEWLRAGAGTRAVVRDRLADHTSREELCAAMARGPRLAVYLGHGRETGWTGYRALRWHHLAAHEQARPCGTVAAFACSTLKRTRGVVPFGTRWAMEGRAGAYFGSVAAVRVEPGFRMAEELGRVLAEGRRQTLGAAVAELHRRLSADPERGAELRELAGFRIIGNPLQPLY